MANIRSFRELRVWQLAMQLAMDVFEASKEFPTSERFALVDQVRRSSRSVAANIAEAWRKRRYPAAFVAKLNDAEAEAAETQTHLEIAIRCRYLADQVAQKLDSKYEEVLAMLVVMSARPQDWVVGTATVRGSASPRPRVSASPRLTGEVT